MKLRLQADVENLRKMAIQADEDGNGNAAFVYNQIADQFERGNDWDVADLFRAVYNCAVVSEESKFRSLKHGKQS